MSLLKTYAVLGSLVLQLATCTVVFGFLGYLYAHRTHHAWWLIVGVFVGLGVGISGFAFLAKQLLGDKK